MSFPRESSTWLLRPGNTIYARGSLEGEAGSRYNVMHVGDPLDRPGRQQPGRLRASTRAQLAWLSKVIPGGLLLTDSARETLDGDLVISGTFDTPLDFIPHAPRGRGGRTAGHLIVNDRLYMAGKYQVGSHQPGSSHGLEPGHVLAIYHKGPRVKDPKARGVSMSGGSAAAVAIARLESWDVHGL